MLKFAATVTGTDTVALARLREKRRTEGVLSLTEDEYQDLSEGEREDAGLNHARYAARRLRDYVRRVVHDGGMFAKGGNSFTHTAVVPQDANRLEAAVALAADRAWVGMQLNTLRVKPRHMEEARTYFEKVMTELIEQEVGNGN